MPVAFFTIRHIHFLTTMKNDSENKLADIIQSAHRSNKKGRWITIILILAFALGLFLWLRSNSNRQPAGPEFTTQKITRGDVALTIITTGTLEPTNQVTIGSEVSGTTLEVYVDINDRVTKGQPLAKLDPTNLAQQTEQTRASLRSAKASITQSQASLKEAKANLKRLEELHRISNGRTPSQADLDASIATVERAEADLLASEALVAQIEAQLISNESDLAKTVLTSPVDGIVLTRSIEPGQTVAAQFQAPELFVIAEDLSSMLLTVAIAEADIARVEPGQEASFTVDAWPKRTFTAKVKTVSYGSEITDNVVTYDTELEVANHDLSLRPGMTATATIAVAQSKEVLLVPNTALRFNPKQAMAEKPSGKTQKKSLLDSLTPKPPRRSSSDKRPQSDSDTPPDSDGNAQVVWILKADRPTPVPVKTGITDGRFTEVSSPDLKSGTPVITSAKTPAQS